jgi:hypothetical protein
LGGTLQRGVKSSSWICVFRHFSSNPEERLPGNSFAGLFPARQTAGRHPAIFSTNRSRKYLLVIVMCLKLLKINDLRRIGGCVCEFLPMWDFVVAAGPGGR